MKSKLLLLCLLLACNCLTAQTNAQPWVPDGSEWHYTLTFFASGDIDYNRLTVQGDSTINGITCNKVQRWKYTCNNRPTVEYFYTDSNRVYYWDSPSNTFLLLYDFNITAGGSYTMTVQDVNNSPPYDQATVFVDSISTLNINGTNRLVQHVHRANAIAPNITYTYNIIEGIGADWQMFPWDVGICDFRYDTGLRCYQDSILGLYNTNAFPICTAVLLSTEEPVTDIRLYPNPSQDWLAWKGELQPPYQVKIQDLQGRTLQETTTFQPQVPTEALPTGMYILRLKDASQQQLTSRFQHRKP